jgi:hypothetical protein
MGSVTEVVITGASYQIWPARLRLCLTVPPTVKAQRQQEIELTGQAQTPEFPVMVPHDLRHSCASLAISAGANVKVLQTLLGHKTATLTLDRYGHLFPDDLGSIADAFDAAVQTTADDLRTIGVLKAVPSPGHPL